MAGITKEVKLLHSKKAHVPILVTELGISIEGNAVQPRKVSELMTVKLLGRTTEVKL